MAGDGKKGVENKGLFWGKAPHPPVKQTSQTNCNDLSPHLIPFGNYPRFTRECSSI